MTTGAESPGIQTLAGLVHINSVNPAYEGGQSESEIVEFIEAFFSEQGIETWRQEVLPERPNLIARLGGATRYEFTLTGARAPDVRVEGTEIVLATAERLVAHARNGTSPLPRLCEAILQQGAGIEAVAVRRPDLADVYLKATGQELTA